MTLKCFVSLILLASLASAEEPAPPDLKKLAEAGRATLARFESGAAKWTGVHQVQVGVQVRIEIQSNQGDRRTVFRVRQGDREEEVFRIWEVGGVWHVEEGGNRGRFRPFEAPLEFPNAYFFLCRSEACFLVDASVLANVRFEAAEGRTATWRVPLPAEAGAMLKRMREDLARLKKQNPEKFNSAELKEHERNLEDLLARGVPTRVDTTSGLIVEQGAPGKSVRIEGFELPEALGKEVLVPPGEWKEMPAAWTPADLPDLAMFNHSAFWEPGQKAPDGDLRLVHMKTGAVRRVPLQGAGMPGCFLRSRNSVVVSALTQEGSLALYEIDILLGTQRLISPELSLGGMLLGPVASSDGRRLAVLHKGSANSILECSLYVIDLETDKAQRVLESVDSYYLSWLPDDSGLVLLVREHSPDLKETRKTICRVDLKGKKTVLLEGDCPQLVENGKALLYMDGEDQWMLADADGRNPRPLPGDHGRLRYASPGPDGNRVLFLLFEDKTGPKPVVVDVRTGEMTRLKVPRGLWMMPAWR